MFDLSRITDVIGNLLGGQPVQETLAGGGLAELLAKAGIDVSILDGLKPGEITDLLAQNGIDLSQVPESEIAGLFASADGEQVLSLLGNLGLGERPDRA